MRFWPFAHRARHAVHDLPSDAYLLTEEALRRGLEDLFVVKEHQAQGLVLRWGGELLVAPSEALRVVEARFKPYGYTPFLKRNDGRVWIEAVPLPAAGVRRRPVLNLVLFLLTVLSTFMAGALPIGAIPFVNWDPLQEPIRPLHGLH